MSVSCQYWGANFFFHLLVVYMVIVWLALLGACFMFKQKAHKCCYSLYLVFPFTSIEGEFIQAYKMIILYLGFGHEKRE